MHASTVRAPVFGRHQFFGTSEHYGKAHGSLLSGWMNYNYTACWWFPTSSNIFDASVGMCFQVWLFFKCSANQKHSSKHALIKYQSPEVNVFHNLTLFYLRSHKNKLDKTLVLVSGWFNILDSTRNQIVLESKIHYNTNMNIKKLSHSGSISTAESHRKKSNMWY